MTDAVTRIITIGERLNNPLNIKRSKEPWKGKTVVPQHEIFESFESPFFGIRAGAKNLLTYYRRDKLDTVMEIVSKWAPPSDDNDTGAYILAVASRMGGDVQPETPLNLEIPEVLTSLVIAMMRQEIGPLPKSYTPQLIDSAVLSAYGGGTTAQVVASHPVQPDIMPIPPSAPAPPPVAPQPIPIPNTGKPPLVDQPTDETTNKVKAATLGALAGYPVAWIAKVFFDQYGPGEPMPLEVALGISALASSAVAYIAGYYRRNRATNQIQT